MFDRIKKWIKNHKMHIVLIAFIMVLLISIPVFTALGIFSPEDTSVRKEKNEYGDITFNIKFDLMTALGERIFENGNMTNSLYTSDNTIRDEVEDDANGETVTTENSNNISGTESGTSFDSSESIPSSESSGSSSSGSSSQTTHTHLWQEHTATRWVSNWVTVTDIPEQTIYGARLYTQHSDGSWVSDGEEYWFENGFTTDDLASIIKDKIKNEGYIGNYLNISKTVPAVTHEEDQGYYETYVDYQYCSCGATRPPQ